MERNETKHTPGPWKTWREVGFEVFPAAGGTRIASVTALGNGAPPFGIDEATGEANARLIAAAPTLLDELRCNQGMVDHVTRCVSWFRDNWQQATPQEVQTWTENLMSCVTPRAERNEAAIALATSANLKEPQQ